MGQNPQTPKRLNPFIPLYGNIPIQSTCTKGIGTKLDGDRDTVNEQSGSDRTG
ncbi:hypothetical protein HJTV-2_gp47 [Haloarcula virus HJTV-2]|uniref:Uncharacterized protein n=1 Tax=Haloarcula virus HJTV-2 TaxID=2877986 RepID=A0AAE8XWX7_9CAUD|nr:hypothetical protein M1M33_gp100 [Haloarcula virus HJTV-2]UBF21667.1 hypothetical protein HJTV-2_gp47 [Haloarcula virus HJTV-2]